MLKDVAINQNLHDIFSIDILENGAFYTSLLRANTSERALREGKFYARGMKIGDAYSFGIKFKPPYDNSIMENRCIDLTLTTNVLPKNESLG